MHDHVRLPWRRMAITAGTVWLGVLLVVSCQPRDDMDIETHIFRVHPEALNPDGPTLTVVHAGDAEAAENLYRKAAREDIRLRAGEPAVAILRTPVLSHMDEVEVRTARRDDREITLVVELRVFGGALAGSVERVGLIRADLGTLSPGPYTVEATLQTTPFVPEGGPTPASDPSQSVSSLDFDVHEHP